MSHLNEGLDTDKSAKAVSTYVLTSVFLDFGLNFAIVNLNKINNKINILNKELEKVSKKEARTIFFAFLIQLIIFFSSQYF